MGLLMRIIQTKVILVCFAVLTVIFFINSFKIIIRFISSHETRANRLLASDVG